jgi:hypothetical protein
LGRQRPNLAPILRALDEVIRAGIPGLHYGVKFERAFYGRPELGWIVEIAPYHVSVNVLFLGGAAFDQPPPLGDVGATRYVKLRTLDEARQPQLVDWVEQAGRHPGWK